MPEAPMPRNPGSEECAFLYVVGQLTTGGSERQLFLLLRALDRRRHPAVVVDWGNDPRAPFSERLTDLGVPVFGLRGIPAAKLARLRALARRLAPDVVHSYTFHLNVAAESAARVAGAVGVGSIRAEFAYGRQRAGPVLGRLSSRWPRFQVANSERARAQAASWVGPFRPARVVHVPNGVDLGTSWPSPPPQGDPLVLGVGALVPDKRWDLLLDATAALRRRGLRFTVAIAGDGPLRAELLGRTQALGLAEAVRFLGTISDVGRELARATLLVHPSDTEGSPNAVLEALAAGRPSVVSRGSDAGALVEDGVHGFVVPRGDAAALARAMGALLEDPAMSAKMGEQGRLRAEREFGVERLVERTLAAYREAGWRDR